MEALGAAAQAGAAHPEAGRANCKPVMREISLDEAKKLKVFILDILCITPYYDKYIYEHIKQINPATSLGALPFSMDSEYLKTCEKPLLLNIVEKLNIKRRKLRRSLTHAQYYLNLSILTVSFVFRRPDIIHVQWLPMLPVNSFEIWFIKFFKFLGIKLVYTVHDILPHDSGRKYFGIYYKAYNLMDLVICHTMETRDTLELDFNLPSDKINVIPHGPIFHDCPGLSKEDARRKLGISRKSVVLYLGYIRQYKGLPFLLESWAKVVEKNYDSCLVLAGQSDNKYKNKLMELVDSLGLKRHVKTDFTFIGVADLPVYYQAADILVYPYKAVTQSGALMTGMPFGKPIIATSVGGLKEVIDNGRNGILVEYGDVPGLTEAISRLMVNKEERERLGKNALDDCKVKYSWETIAQETLSCYWKALEGV